MTIALKARRLRNPLYRSPPYLNPLYLNPLHRNPSAANNDARYQTKPVRKTESMSTVYRS